jgi:hypothetical protein
MFFELTNEQISIYNFFLKNNEAGHSTYFQGGDNAKVEGRILQNQYAKQSYILLSL